MKTFVIFDTKTGEVLQTHVQIGDVHGSPTEFLRGAQKRPESVSVMEVESLRPGVSYRVDTKAGKLVEVDGKKVRGSGGAFVLPARGDPKLARTLIFDRVDKAK
jgi:hypothetical protein